MNEYMMMEPDAEVFENPSYVEHINKLLEIAAFEDREDRELVEIEVFV